MKDTPTPKNRNGRRKSAVVASNIPFWEAKAICLGSIKEAPVAVTGITREHTSPNWQGIEFYVQPDSPGSGRPLLAVDLIANAFLRLTYHSECDRTANLGSSVLGSISFRTEDNTLHYVPTVSSANFTANDPRGPTITLHANFGELASLKITRSYSLLGTPAPICQVETSFEALTDIKLSQRNLGNDTFRFCTVSSMFTPECYDANCITHEEASGATNHFQLDTHTPRGTYLFTRSIPIHTALSVKKDSGSNGKKGTPGAKESPSVVLSLNHGQHALGVQAYLDTSTNVNDDSLSVWVEWRNAPKIISRGSIIQFSYAVTAEAPASL